MWYFTLDFYFYFHTYLRISDYLSLPKHFLRQKIWNIPSTDFSQGHNFKILLMRIVQKKKKYNKTFLQPPIGPRAFLTSADRAFFVDCAVFYAKLHSTGLSGCIKDKLVIMTKTLSTGSRNKFCWNIHVLCLRDRMFRHLLHRCFCRGEFHVPRIAVVGSGPAGFYTAQQILKVRASDTVSVFTSRKSNFQNSVCLEFSMESAYR